LAVGAEKIDDIVYGNDIVLGNEVCVAADRDHNLRSSWTPA